MWGKMLNKTCGMNSIYIRMLTKKVSITNDVLGFTPNSIKYLKTHEKDNVVFVVKSTNLLATINKLKMVMKNP